MDAHLLTRHRSDKDNYLASDTHSPMPFEYRGSFSGLPYFDLNADLIYTTDLDEADGANVTIATSDGSERSYRRAAKITIEVGGVLQTLALFDTGHPGMFLPFRDTTSGRETYGGGRYLDLAPATDGSVTIDFNLAYSPFCAYNDGYSCALPPTENWMTVPIEAGEKIWRKPA